jgi:hypothetical protein
MRIYIYGAAWTKALVIDLLLLRYVFCFCTMSLLLCWNDLFVGLVIY